MPILLSSTNSIEPELGEEFVGEAAVISLSEGIKPVTTVSMIS
jgi:hypothetical protein